MSHDDELMRLVKMYGDLREAGDVDEPPRVLEQIRAVVAQLAMDLRAWDKAYTDGVKDGVASALRESAWIAAESATGDRQ